VLHSQKFVIELGFACVHFEISVNCLSLSVAINNISCFLHLHHLMCQLFHDQIFSFHLPLLLHLLDNATFLFLNDVDHVGHLSSPIRLVFFAHPILRLLSQKLRIAFLLGSQFLHVALLVHLLDSHDLFSSAPCLRYLFQYLLLLLLEKGDPILDLLLVVLQVGELEVDAEH